MYVIERHADIFLWLASSCQFPLLLSLSSFISQVPKDFYILETSAFIHSVYSEGLPTVCERSFCFLCSAFDRVLQKSLHIMKYIHLLFSCLYILRQLESFVLRILKRNLTIFYPNSFVFSITNVHVKLYRTD